jgi:hypothetical protein
LILVLAGLGLADTIRLKDGSRVKGRIISFKGNKFTVEMGEGSRRRELTFTAAEIESIEFDQQGIPPQLTAPARKDVYKAPVQPAAAPSTVKVSASTETKYTPPPAPKSSGEKMAPIGWNIKVLADNTANGWTNSGWVVKKGQRIRVSGEGTVSLGRGASSPASGLGNLEDSNKLLKNVPTGALVAVIGDDNNDFIYVGAEREFTATRDGALFLGINEGNLEDNSGSFNVKVEILPDDAN